MRTIAIGCVVWTLLVVGPAVAQEDEEEEDEGYARRGVYALLQGNYFIENFSTAIEPEGSFGASGHIGYRLNRRFAAEFQVDWLKDFDFESGGAKVARITNGWTTTVNGKAFFSTGWIQPYAVAGIGVMGVTLDDEITGGAVEDTGFAFRTGVGADFYGDENLALNVELGFVNPTGSASEYDYVSLAWGLLLRF